MNILLFAASPPSISEIEQYVLVGMFTTAEPNNPLSPILVSSVRTSPEETSLTPPSPETPKLRGLCMSSQRSASRPEPEPSLPECQTVPPLIFGVPVKAGDANGAFVESATVISLLPSNETPFIFLAVASFVAVPALPDTDVCSG